MINDALYGIRLDIVFYPAQSISFVQYFSVTSTGSGVISFEEFREWYSRHGPKQSQQSERPTLQMRQQLQQEMQLPPQQPEQQQLQQQEEESRDMFKAFDKDGDG